MADKILMNQREDQLGVTTTTTIGIITKIKQLLEKRKYLKYNRSMTNVRNKSN